MLKHPLFTGQVVQPEVRLADYKPAFNKDDDTITISGKVVTDRPVHSIMLNIDRGKPDDEYGHPSLRRRIAPGGAFRLQIKSRPLKLTAGPENSVLLRQNGMAAATAFRP